MKKIKLFFTALVALATASIAFAQNVNVSGTVTDAANGEAVPGAAVQLVGSATNYALTDALGNYSIAVPADGVLAVSCLGYTSVEVPVGGKAVVNIALEADTQVLEETIVVAYGTATKSSFTGSASMVKSESIESHVATNVTSALAGTTPGVQIISSSGDPTSNGQTIRIRGFGSMSASNNPLYVLDGVPFDGSISDINPNDVESISVLKDASAAAIYGARGANGVVLITTKKAQGRDAKVKFDAKLGSNSRLIPQYDVITDPGQYYETYYKLLYNQQVYAGATSAEAHAFANKNLFDEKNGGLGYKVFTVPEGENLIGTNFKLNPNAKLGYFDGTYYYTPDDWYKEAFHNSFRQEYNLSVAGGSDKFSYYASAGFLNDGGIVNNSGYKRYTGRVNADYQAKKWMKFVTTLAFTHSESETPEYSSSYGSSGNIFYVCNTMGPIYPLYVRGLDENGNPYILQKNGKNWYDANDSGQKRPNTVGNAVRENEFDAEKKYVDAINGKFGAVLTPVKGLTLNANVGFMSYNSRFNALYSQFASSASVDGEAYVSHDRYFTVNQQYTAQYKESFGLNNVDILAGFENYSLLNQSLSGQNDHLFNPYIGELNNADGFSKKKANSNTNSYKTKGLFLRASYEYAGKYFVSASYRRDASSRFAPGHQWGNFGSIGAAWVISEEDFLKGSNVFNLLKLKASYGVQGNDNLLSDYPYMDNYTHSYNEETGEYSLVLNYKGNENLTWESSKAFNAGVDFELVGGILNGTIEYYSRTTSDLLFNKDVPLSSGNPLGYMPVNVGSILNNGVEVTLYGDIIKTKNVTWDWNFNISSNHNEIKSLDESIAKDGIKGSNYWYYIGGSLYQAYMRQFAGLDDQGRSLWYYNKTTKDAEGNEIVTKETTTVFSSASQYDCGTILPKAFGGFGTTLKAFGFDLSCQFSYQLGGRYYDGSYQALMHTQPSAGQAWHKDALKAWTPENTNTNVPRLDGDTQVGQVACDCYLISSNYLSVNNVTLGYTFPAKITKKVGIEGLRVYVAGENLAVLTARKGIDPRYSVGLGSFTSDSGLNTGAYSAMRNITGGITLTF